MERPKYKRIQRLSQKTLKELDRETLRKERERPLPDPGYDHEGKILDVWGSWSDCERITYKYGAVDGRCPACQPHPTSDNTESRA